MKKLEVRADRENAVYAQGETIVFGVKGEEFAADAEIEYTVRMDSVETLETGKTAVGGEIRIEAGTPGFIDISVTDGTSRAEAAAAVDPEKIRPTLPRPNDFKSFWERKLKELAEVPMAPRIKKIPAPPEADYQAWNAKWPYFGDTLRQFLEIDVFEVEVDTLSGEPVRGYYALPSGAAAQSLPAVLFTHGAGIGDSDLAKTCAAAQHGFLAMDINAHGLEMGQPPEYYAAIAKEVRETCGSFFRKGRLDKETLYPVTMYLRHRRALDFLCSRPEWDGRDLIVRGASQGGCLALACAGLDPRVSAICAGVPALSDCARAYPMRHWFIDEEDDLRTIACVKDAVRYISVENFAPDIKADAYFTVAFLDRSCHPTTVYAAYNVYGGPKRIYNGPTADHGGIPNAVHYDDCARFMMGREPKLA